MQKIITYICLPLLVLLFAAPGFSDEPASGDVAVKMIRVNFVPLRSLATLLEEVKSTEGKVIVREESGTLVLMDTAERVLVMEGLVAQIDVQKVTRNFSLHFADILTAVDDVRPLLTQSIGAIAADTSTGIITVTDTPLVVEQVRRALDLFDARGRLFILEAKLIHITLDDENLNGVDWAGIVADYQTLTLEGVYGFLGGKGRPTVLNFGTLEAQDFTPLVEALDTLGQVREYPLGTVQIEAGNDVQMTVRMDDPLILLEKNINEEDEASTDDAEADQDKPAIHFSLKVFLDEEGFFKTNITPQEPEEALRSAWVKTATNRRGRGAVVRLTPGSNIVIGGLIASENIATQRKIPLMGDLPFLGFAFRYHNSTVRREEFVVILTPKLVAPVFSQVNTGRVE